MSVRTMNWALEQATGDPRAQCLLYVVADAASPEGIAWPSADWLATKSQQSRATVYRRLSNLQDMGLLVLLPRYIDDDGKIWMSASPGRRRTSPEIRLQLGVFIKQNDPPADDGEDAEAPAPQSQAETGVSHGSDGPVSPERRGLSHCGDSKNPNLNQEDSPQPPKGGEPQRSNEFEEKKLASWERFEQAWTEPILRQSIARQIWWALTEAEEAVATKAGQGYVIHRRAQKKPPNVINAHTFLRERDAWPRYAALAPPEPVPATQILAGSAEWRALQLMRRVAGFSPLDGAAKFAGEVPAGSDGLAAFVGPDGAIDTDAWSVCEAKLPDGRDAPRFIAWRERAHEWLKVWIEPERIYLEPRGCATGVLRMQDNTERYYRRFVMGLLVPSVWPPPKHGAARSTGPPHAA